MNEKEISRFLPGTMDNSNSLKKSGFILIHALEKRNPVFISKSV